MALSTLLFSVLPLALSAAASSSFPSSSQGCFSSSGDLHNTRSSIFQSIDRCVNECGAENYDLAGLKGEQCWCGNSLPSLDDLVSDDKCDTACPGYATDMCGGDNAWSLWSIGNIEPSAWTASTSTTESTSTETRSPSTGSETSSATSSETSSTTTTSSLIAGTTSAASSTTPTPSPSAASESASSTSTSILPTFTGNSASRRYSFLW
ncbi:WSC domain-containing protein [Aspergillus heterothallicus]